MTKLHLLVSFSLLFSPLGAIYAQTINFTASRSLKNTTLQIEKILLSPKFNSQTCEKYADAISKFLQNSRPAHFDRKKIGGQSSFELPPGTEKEGSLDGPNRDVFKILWDTRVVLNERLREFVATQNFSNRESFVGCADAIKVLIRELRSFDELWRLTTTTTYKTISQGSLIFEKKWPFSSLNTRFKPNWNFEKDLESGDIVLSRGTAFTTAAIARVAEISGHYSHIGIVYRDVEGKFELYNEANGQTVYWQARALNKVSIVDGTGSVVSMDQVRVRNVQPGSGIKGQLYIVESLVNHGLQITPLEAYLADPKTRFMTLRLKNLSSNPRYTPLNVVASKAAELLVQRAAREKVCYNFTMNMNDNSCLFCTQAISTGLALACKEPGFNCEKLSKFESPNMPAFPLYYTRVDIDRIDFAKTLGITERITFSPSDVEVDPRAVPTGEWFDLKSIAQARYHDVAMTKIVQWMKEGKYETKRSPIIDKIATASHRLILASEKFPANTPKSFITGTLLLGLIVKSPQLPAVAIDQIQLLAPLSKDVGIISNKFKNEMGLEVFLEKLEKNTLIKRRTFLSESEMYLGLESLRVIDCKNWNQRKNGTPVFFHDILSSDVNVGEPCQETPFALTGRF